MTARRKSFRRMQYLRAWRDSLRLSRQNVADKLTELTGSLYDQATVAKWESGEVAIRAEDLILLAEVYGVRADHLFHPPGDDYTPEALRLAHSIIRGKDREAVRRWLASGADLRDAENVTDPDD